MSPSDAFPPASSPHDPAPIPHDADAQRRTGFDSAVEQFAREYLKDRRSERRWRVFFRISWLLLVLMVFWSLFAVRTSSAPSGRHTALVEIRGEISSESEASAELLAGALRNAFEDAGSQAVVLRINSPGGSPVQAGIINDEIRRLKALHGKKVYAVVEEVCASGAYYIAVAADEIYADKASIVGSIGVLMEGFGFTGLMDKLGVDRRLITAGANKAMNDPFQPLDEKHRVYLQAMIDQIHQQFIRVVKEGRGDRLQDNGEIFSGLFWNGEDAVRLGLVDKIGNLDYVAREVVKAEEVIDYTPRENVAERLAKRFGASVGAGAVNALQALGGLR